jgi:hypothetical protein
MTQYMMHDGLLAVRRLQILSSKDEEMDLGRSPSNVGSSRNMQGLIVFGYTQP